MLLLLQSCGREEQQEQHLEDTFFDFSDLPNYGDVAYLRRVIMQSSSNNSSSTTSGGELRWSHVYEQLLHQFKAYSNNEGLQLQLLTYLHGALLTGRPEVLLHLPPGMLPVPTLPLGLLTAALQVSFSVAAAVVVLVTLTAAAPVASLDISNTSASLAVGGKGGCIWVSLLGDAAAGSCPHTRKSLIRA